jgi:hypothetical protein
MKRLWITASASLGLVFALAMGASAQYQGQSSAPIDMGQSGTAQPSAPNVIPEGTQFEVQLQDSLDTNKVSQGKSFKAKLAQDLIAPDGNTIPMGSKVKGHVSSVERGMSSRLLLSFDQIETKHGWVPLAAMVTGVPGEHSVQAETGSEGEINHRKVDTKHTVQDAAIGAGLGAVAGAAAGGGKGAAIGAAIGGGLGTGAGFLTGRNFKLNKGQALDLRLERDIYLPR